MYETRPVLYDLSMLEIFVIEILFEFRQLSQILLEITNASVVRKCSKKPEIAICNILFENLKKVSFWKPETVYFLNTIIKNRSLWRQWGDSLTLWATQRVLYDD